MTTLSVKINGQRIEAATLPALQVAFVAFIDANNLGSSECRGASRAVGGWKISGPVALRNGADYLSYNGRAWRGKWGSPDHAAIGERPARVALEVPA